MSQAASSAQSSSTTGNGGAANINSPSPWILIAALAAGVIVFAIWWKGRK